MRFCLNFKVEKHRFPKDYRRMILSYIKKSLSEILDGVYIEKYFKDNIQKDFSFSVKFPQNSKFTKDEIILGNLNVEVLFTTSDRQKTGLILQQAFLKQKYKIFKISNQNSIQLTSIKRVTNQKIINSKAIFRTYGLCVRNHSKDYNGKDIYYVYNDEKFNEQLKIVLGNQAKTAGFRKNIVDDIQFTPLNCKKVLAEHYNTLIDITVGSFLLEGNPQFIQYLYDTGLGSRNSCFGYLDLITQEI